MAPGAGRFSIQYDITARTATDSAHLVYTAKRLFRFTPPAQGCGSTTSITPRGNAWWPSDEFLPVSVRAVEGAEVRICFPTAPSSRSPSPQPEDQAGACGHSIGHDEPGVARRADRYVEQSEACGRENPGPLWARSALPPSPPARRSPSARPSAVVEAIIGADTARATWNLRLALSTARRHRGIQRRHGAQGDTDSLTIGRTRPGHLSLVHAHRHAHRRDRAAGR